MQTQLHERCKHFWAEKKILDVIRVVCRPTVEIDEVHRLQPQTLSQYFHPTFYIKDNDDYNRIAASQIILTLLHCIVASVIPFQ